MKDFNVNETARMIAEGLEEALKVQGRKTVPRQTNMPNGTNGTNPYCQTNVPPRASERVKRAQADDDIYMPLGKPIYNPLDWRLMDMPKIGDKVYMVVPNMSELIVVVDEFHGTEMELLLLAQRRLFVFKEEAVRYKMKCEAVIAAMETQMED